MDDEYINLLIEKFWKGDASENEQLQLYTYLTDNNFAFKEKEREAFDQFEQSATYPKSTHSDHILKIINDKIKEKEKATRFRILKKITGWAAAIILFFMSVILIRNTNSHHIKNEPNNMAILEYDTVLNTSENIKLITLSDKSTVKLYPQSSIIFESGFKNRNINLKGRAFFKVVHDDKNIFSVTTNEIVTTDIGTEFEINTLNKGRINIRLLKGKIKVGKTKNSKLSIQDQFLNNGEQLNINTENGKFKLIKKSSIIENTELSYYNKNKELNFDKTPLNIVFKIIAKKYDAKIIFNKIDVANLTFTGNIEANDLLENILKTICYMNNLHYDKNEASYIIER